MMTAEAVLRLMEVAQACRYLPPQAPVKGGRHSRATDLPKDPTGETVADPVRWRVSLAYSRLLRLTSAGLPWYHTFVQAAAIELEAALQAWEGVNDRGEVRGVGVLPTYAGH